MTLAMLVGWVFFYFTDLHEAVRSLQVLFGLGGAGRSIPRNSGSIFIRISFSMR